MSTHPSGQGPADDTVVNPKVTPAEPTAEVRVTAGEAPPARPPVNPSTKPRKRRIRLLVGIILGVFLLIVVAFYAVGYAVAGDKLPKDTIIGAVPVGGLTQAQAVAKLEAELGPKANAPVVVTIDGKQEKIEPATAGLSVNFADSVAKASADQSLDPRVIWRVLTGGTTEQVDVQVDDAALTQSVDTLADKYDSTATDATIAIEDGKVVTSEATDGIRVQREPAVAAIKEAYYRTSSPVELAVDRTEPEITTAEVEAVADDFVEPALSGPITVKVGAAGKFTLSEKLIAKAISFETADGTVTGTFDGKQLFKAAHDEIAKVELKKPKDATVRLRDGKPRVIPAVNGTDLKEADFIAAVEPALTKTGAGRTVAAKLSDAKATFSTEDAKNLKIRQVTGEFTSSYPYANYRNVNLSRVAKFINGTVLKPGDTFSLNGIVGERTADKGFVKGGVIVGGNKLEEQLGGGISQSATTIYNAMFFAGLTDIEHQPHSLYFDRYPAGREATVAWPNLDLKFGNDTKYGVLVQAFVSPASPGGRGSITVRMWSSKTYDKVASSALKKSNFTTGRDIKDDSPKCVATEPAQGFDVNYSRLFYQDGKVVKREKFFWRYAPTDKRVCTNN